jgi:hypothetical protein
MRLRAMALFFLHLHNGLGFLPDEEGRELPDLEAARQEAVRSIRSLLAEEITGGRIDLAGRVEIAGADGETLAQVRYAEAIEIVGGGDGA